MIIYSIILEGIRRCPFYDGPDSATNPYQFIRPYLNAKFFILLGSGDFEGVEKFIIRYTITLN